MTKNENPFSGLKLEPPLNVDFLVLEGASMMNLAGAADPLRAANRVSGRTLFTWRYLSADGQAPTTSSGMPWPVSGRFKPSSDTDIFGVIAGFWASDITARGLIADIYRAAKRSRLTLGIEAGTWVLARAGLLDGHAATTHWEDFEEFASTFPMVDLRAERFVVDGRVATSAGASPTFDMMIALVGQCAGRVAARDVVSAFVHDSIRDPADAQLPEASHAHAGRDPRILQAIRAMERGIDTPVTIAAIARRLSLSVRGLEQLFQRETGNTPGAYFRLQRLNVARRLLTDTRLPLADIALRTGFSSSSALSRAFKRAHGVAPSSFRVRQIMAP